MVNWQHDKLNIQQGGIIIPKVSSTNSEFSWSGQLTFNRDLSLFLQSQGSFLLPFSYRVAPFDLMISKGAISDISLTIQPKRGADFGQFLDFEVDGTAKLSTQWQISRQQNGMRIQNVREAQNWLAKHYTGLQDFNIAIVRNGQKWRFQTHQKNSTTPNTHFLYAVGPADQRHFTLSMDRDQITDYITFEHTAHKTDSHNKIGGMWLKSRPDS